MAGRHLSRLLDEAAARRPGRAAVEDERGGALAYAELHHCADRLATRLARWGVGRGDRVGVWLPKRLEAIAAVHGVLRSGAAYVPVDPTGPIERGAAVLAMAGVKAAVVDTSIATALQAAWPGAGAGASAAPRLIVVESENQNEHKLDGDAALWRGAASWAEIMADDAPSPLPPLYDENDLAYILFTSGSTGRPKGVMHSHANAWSFLDWCRAALGPWRDDDRFASHAPAHFDLSVLDFFLSCRNAATLVLIGEELGKAPGRLGAFLAERSIDVWYSAPSILSLLVDHGGIDRAGFPAPRLVLFAGEVFPIGALRRLRDLWPRARMWNLYGPTETNVCTAQMVPETVPDDREGPYPIGRVCPPMRARVVGPDGLDAPAGAIGELWISGQGVMHGYFGEPELTRAAFARDGSGTNWYRTGDLVSDEGSGCFTFHGRRDRMVKRRGYRIELGEIEQTFHRHEGVDRAGVVARASDEAGVAIEAFVALKPGRKKSIIAMKRHCARYLPHYMVPDTITFLDGMPTTSTDKVDYPRLAAHSAGEGARP